MSRRTHRLIIAATALISLTAAASEPFDLNALLETIDRHGVSRMEEVLPLLPEGLRSGFTLQYRGNGLQEASFEFPRAILFGEDAKLVLTFNGHPSQGQYQSLEILQYNERASSFELYALTFPIRKDADGKTIRPEKNPAECLSCHGSDPHPIWGRYNFWPGMYGSHDDKLSSEEMPRFIDFMANRHRSERYLVLNPPEGSSASPFSSNQVETLSFRPNDQLGSLLVRLNAKSLAKKLRLSPDYLKYLLLMSPAMYSCEHRFTKADLDALARKLLAEFRSRGFERLPAPGKKPYELDNLAHLVGSTISSWGLDPVNSPLDPFFLDRFLLTTPNYVLNELKDEFFSTYPELRSLYQPLPFSVYSGIRRLVQTDLDRKIIRINDSLGVALKVSDAANCALQIARVKKTFL